MLLAELYIIMKMVNMCIQIACTGLVGEFSTFFLFSNSNSFTSGSCSLPLRGVATWHAK